MREFNCLSAIPASFYSKKLYRDVATQWGANVVLYLLLVIALGWIVLMFQTQKFINQGVHAFVTEYVPQIPTMTFKDGSLSTPENRAYYVKGPKNEVFAIIDVTGAHTDTDVPMLITKDKMIVKKKQETRIVTFDKGTNITVDPNKVGNVIVKVMNYSWVIILPLLIFFSFCYRLLEALIYSIFGILFASIQGVSLTYGQIYKMTFFAMTPAMVVSILASVLHWPIPYWALVYFLLSMGYLIFATRANK